MVPGTVMGPAMVNVEIADRSTKEPTAELAKRAPWSTLEERTINILGCNINYIDVGSGEVVVFLHNGGGFWQVWWHQIKHFAETHRVLAFDWPGFGESGDIGEPLTVDSAARTLGAFTDALALHDIILIGNCIGAAVAIRYQNLHPAKVRALVLMNICPGRRIVRFRPMRTLLYDLESRCCGRAFADWRNSSPSDRGLRAGFRAYCSVGLSPVMIRYSSNIPTRCAKIGKPSRGSGCCSPAAALRSRTSFRTMSWCAALF